MKKRTVIITGANSGIGKAASYKFAREGHTVIMACRSLERSRNVQQEVIRVSGNNRVDLMEVDTSSINSIRSFCDAFQNKYPKLDVLIHNAAYFRHGAKYTLSADHIELTFATNVVGPYLMTTLLRDPLRKSDNPRILHAGSNIIKHFFDPGKKIDFDILQGNHPDPKRFRVYNSYRESKMALLMLTFLMAEEYRLDEINVNMLQINGATMSKETIAKLTPGYRFIARIQNVFFRAPEFMAGHYYDICTSERFKDITGKLINHRQEIMQPGLHEPGLKDQLSQVLGAGVYPAYAGNSDVANRLWDLCANLTGNL